MELYVIVTISGLTGFLAMSIALVVFFIYICCWYIKDAIAKARQENVEALEMECLDGHVDVEPENIEEPDERMNIKMRVPLAN